MPTNKKKRNTRGNFVLPGVFFLHGRVFEFVRHRKKHKSRGDKFSHFTTTVADRRSRGKRTTHTEPCSTRTGERSISPTPVDFESSTVGPRFRDRWLDPGTTSGPPRLQAWPPRPADFEPSGAVGTSVAVINFSLQSPFLMDGAYVETLTTLARKRLFDVVPVPLTSRILKRSPPCSFFFFRHGRVVSVSKTRRNFVLITS